MPGKHTSVLPSTDDLLVRLLDLPPHEQNTVLRQVAQAVHAAEQRTLCARPARPLRAARLAQAFRRLRA